MLVLCTCGDDDEDRFENDNKCSSSCDVEVEGEEGDDYGDQGCTGQPFFFAPGQGRAGQRKKFLGRGGAGRKSSGRGGVTVKLGAFSGRAGQS